MKIKCEIGFVVSDVLGDGKTYYVVAPQGYSFKDGKAVQDPKGFRSPSPEWGSRENAHVFKSHRSAARTRNVCGSSATIQTIEVTR